MRVLVVEDYAPLREAIAKGLVAAGFQVDAVADGEQGYIAAMGQTYAVIVLDIMLPGVDGLTVLRRLREAHRNVHVLLLTAKDAVEDRVAGLDCGADDYLVKPFIFTELVARVRALVRRSFQAKDPVVRVADLSVDTAGKRALRAGCVVPLTPREYALLEYLALRAGNVVSRAEIREQLYDFAADATSNVIDVYVTYVRRKLEAGGAPRLLHTRRGMGYVLAAES